MANGAPILGLKVRAFGCFAHSVSERVAEAVRFELTEDVNPRRFSRPVP